MIIKIGIVAGEIWRLLEKEDKLPLPMLLSKVGKDIAENENVVCMGVGWLAREGHIVMEKEDSGYSVYLRKPSPKKI
ncbi:MAG: winged helix-turn-helix domain-containing protein [Candidatus Omnitrophica bacterium]|nr:winged helix-turn-helix domain-containing protein [Candidatus Omnitrophota bacterium]